MTSFTHEREALSEVVLIRVSYISVSASLA